MGGWSFITECSVVIMACSMPKHHGGYPAPGPRHWWCTRPPKRCVRRRPASCGCCRRRWCDRHRWRHGRDGPAAVAGSRGDEGVQLVAMGIAARCLDQQVDAKAAPIHASGVGGEREHGREQICPRCPLARKAAGVNRAVRRHASMSAGSLIATMPGRAATPQGAQKAAANTAVAVDGDSQGHGRQLSEVKMRIRRRGGSACCTIRLARPRISR